MENVVISVPISFSFTNTSCRHPLLSSFLHYKYAVEHGSLNSTEIGNIENWLCDKVRTILANWIMKS